jgi:phosphate transport system substrate-binding protein
MIESNSSMQNIGLAIVLCTSVLACRQGHEPTGDTSHQTFSIASRATLRGAGATFPYLVYSKWAFHHHENTGLRLSYDQVGSQAGVAAAKAGDVDFGTTDIPLTDEELERDGLIQFPMVIGGVVPVVHLPGVGPGALVLSPNTLARIFAGTITRWDAEEIRTENPDIEFPDREITPIHRAGSSGSTWIFTSFLSRCCDEWRTQVGAGPSVTWPVGVSARGNEQVARFVRQFEFTIAYIEFAHANESDLAWVGLTIAGQTVTPKLSGFEKTAADSTWHTGTSMRLTPPVNPDPSNWPIVGASYVVVRKQPKSAHRTQRLFGFLHWALTQGVPLARELNYATVPDGHVATIEQLWKEQIRVNDKAIW